MKQKKYNKSGLSLIELMLSAVLGIVLIGIVLTAWYFTYKNWALDRIRTKNRVDLQVSMERIKAELRLSSATYLSLYKPAGGSDYTAISFPMGDDNLLANFFGLDASGLINWDRSAIYYAYDNAATGHTELRRMEFTGNNAVLTDSAQRDTQLANVVANGDGSGGPNAAGASTPRVIVEKLTSLIINPQAQEFDGYSATLKKSDNVTFGSIRLASGDHDFTFEVTGKNAASSGYGLGIDALSITPSGCRQEMEVYSPLATSTADSSGKVGPNLLWSGNHFHGFDSDAVGDFITFRLYYDTWLEANFDNSVRGNTVLAGSDLSIQLPDLATGNEIAWTAEVEAGSVSGDAVKADFANSLSGITVRNLISSANIDSEGDLLRVKFESHSPAVAPDITDYQLTIAAAYLDQKASGEDCVDPPVTITPDTTRIQLYFTDAAGGISQGITIPAGGTAYSNWAIFPIDSSEDYFVTFYVTGTSFASYWAGTQAADTNSYLVGGSYADQAVWSTFTYLGHESSLPLGDGDYTSSANVYALASLELWSKIGSVTTEVYDTKIADPGYNSTTWSSSGAVSVSGRSSDDPLMGAAAWTVGSVSGTGQYAQAKADLSTTPYWTCIDHSGTNVSDTAYKNVGTITCTVSGCTQYLIPGVSTPWVDNIKVTWPGETKMCDISGYFAQDTDYGIIKLLVDGNELIKGIELDVTVYEDFQGTDYETSIKTEVEPRNTGK